jgi:hypothetical protein
MRSFPADNRMWMSEAGKHLKKDPLKRVAHAVHATCF